MDLSLLQISFLLHEKHQAQGNEATCSGSHTLLCSDKDRIQYVDGLKFCLLLEFKSR